MSNLQIVQQQIDLARPDFESNVQELELNLNFKKEAAFALQIFQKNNYLAKMRPESVRDAIVNVSLTGLTLNPILKMAYLIPRKGQCVLDISYIGLIKILTDTGSVKNIEAKIVYENEPFEIQQGTNSYVKHGIAPTADKGKILGVYSNAILNDGSTSVEWMYYDDVMAVANRSESVKSGGSSPWKTDFTEMTRKTVVKRHYKYLPKSERAILAGTAIDIDHENNGIDFESEKSQKSVNIDLVSPTEENINKYGPIATMIMDERVPEELFSAEGKTRQEFLNDFGSQFNSGTMSVQFADSVLSRLKEYCQ